MIESEPRISKETPVVNFSEEQLRCFWSKVNKNGPVIYPHMDECWIWTAGKSKAGYGRFTVGKATCYAHRIAWILATLEVPVLRVLHRCDNPACVRKSHLWLGTYQDNIRDMVTKGRHAPQRGDDHHSRRHPELCPRGDSHKSSKLTAEKIIEIRTKAAAGVFHHDIAAEYGVTRPNITYIVNRKSWAHVP